MAIRAKERYALFFVAAFVLLCLTVRQFGSRTLSNAAPWVKFTGNERFRTFGAIWKPSVPYNNEPPPLATADNNEDIAFCIVVKDEARDLKEGLIHHYFHVGVRRFYIMDDGSDPPLSTFRDYGIPRSAITFQHFPPAERVVSMQLYLYQQCQKRFGLEHKWLAYLDADEMLEVKGEETLQEMLTRFDAVGDIGALAINWKIHTSSGLLQRAESVRKAFTTCISDKNASGAPTDNIHFKSIVSTRFAGRPVNPHHFNLSGSARYVGEDGLSVKPGGAFRIPITRDKLALHHYALKSKEEYEAKLLRGNAMDDPKNWSFWNSVEYERPHVDCREMAAYIP